MLAILSNGKLLSLAAQRASALVFRVIERIIVANGLLSTIIERIEQNYAWQIYKACIKLYSRVMNELLDQNPSEIGRKLWTARQKHKMSLRDLAKAAEISASMLSQIETGKAFPSVRSLYKIAAALGVSVDYFFPAEDGSQPSDSTSNGATNSSELTASQMREALLTNELSPEVVSFPTTHKTPVVPANGRPRLELNSGITWARLTANSEADTEFLEIKYAPGAQSGKNMSSHSGREFGMVLEGELMVELGFETYTLNQGDSIIFDSTTPHRLTNNGNSTMRALWVVLTPNPV